MPETPRVFKFYRLVVTCQQVATNLSVSSSCNKSVKIRLVATCHLQTCYSLLKQLFLLSQWITSFDYQLATSLLTTCSPSTSCRKPCEPILISACSYRVCCEMPAHLLQTCAFFGCSYHDCIRLVTTLLTSASLLQVACSKLVDNSGTNIANKFNRCPWRENLLKVQRVPTIPRSLKTD